MKILLVLMLVGLATMKKFDLKHRSKHKKYDTKFDNKSKLQLWLSLKSQMMYYLKTQSTLSLQLQMVSKMEQKIKSLKSQASSRKGINGEYNGVIVANELQGGGNVYELDYKDSVSELEVQLTATGSLQDELDLRSKDDQVGYDPAAMNNDPLTDESSIRGDVFMIDRIKRAEDGKNHIEFKKVYVVMNRNKIQIGENANIENQIDVIYMKNVFPRKEMIRDRLQGNYNLYSLNYYRLPLFDIKNALAVKEDQYCFVLLNSNGISTDENILKDRYDQMVQQNGGTAIEQLLRQLYADDKMNNKGNEEPGHQYFRKLFLCGKDLVYMRKWLIFVNKVLIEQQVTFTTMNNTQTSYKTTYKTRQYSKTVEQMQDEATSDELNSLKADEARLREIESKSEKELNKKEMQTLQANLQELSESMTRQENMQQTQISEQMIQMNKIEEEISTKEDQARCVEEALEIRKEAENEQVIKMIKEEELESVSKIVQQAKEKMQKEMMKRMEVLQKRLKYQQQAMEDEKSGVDNMMQNIIEQGLKGGDKKKCVFDDLLDDKGNPKSAAKNQIDEKIENGCAFILQNQQSAFQQDSNGQNQVLNKINMCTKKEYFCDICCETQIGDEKYQEMMGCVNECNYVMEKFRDPSVKLIVPVQNVMDVNTQLQFQQTTETKTKQALANATKK